VRSQASHVVTDVRDLVIKDIVTLGGLLRKRNARFFSSDPLSPTTICPVRIVVGNKIMGEVASGMVKHSCRLLNINI